MTNFLISGEINIKVIERNKGVIKHLYVPNQITNLFRDLIFSQLLTEQTSDPIEKIKYGTGTAPATPTDTDLQNPIGEKNLASHQFQGPSILILNFQEIGYEENVGETITEFGLFTKSGKMIARRLGISQEKTNLIKLEPSWSIAFI